MTPEITWSLMHPTPLDAGYFRRVVREAKSHRVDSFEICGPCHGLESGLDGLIDYALYPQAAKSVDRSSVRERVRCLNEILETSHSGGYPVYYWHRETVVPPGLTNDSPGLLGPDGGFDFFGSDYNTLLRYKIDAAFSACPQLDGIVLTLTEAQYSVIHPAKSSGVNPNEVVRHIVQLTAGELAARGKRFILRSFGSIHEDYHIILHGAEQAAKEVPLEIETKATPFDFIPFFNDNPHLHLTPGCTLSVECDGLGEFLGAGYFPAHGIDDLMRRVEAGRRVGCSRYVLRIDRCGKSLLDSSYEHKLTVFETAVLEGEAAARKVNSDFQERMAPGAADRLKELMETGWQATLKTLFLRGNLIFHTNPVAPRLKWLKAGGFFGVLGNKGSLARLHGIWSILSDQPAPTLEEILREKHEAIAIVERGEALLAELGPTLSPELNHRLLREWHNLGKVTRAMEKFVCFSADMTRALQNREPLSPRFEDALRDYHQVFGLPLLAHLEVDSDAIETNLFATREMPIEEAWLVPIGRIMGQMLSDYEVEYRQREEAFSRPGAVDVIIPGGIADDYRVGRVMHASHAFREHGKLARAVGNRLFPDAEVQLDLLLVDLHPSSIRIETTGGSIGSVPIPRLDQSILILSRWDGPSHDFHLPPKIPKAPLAISFSSGLGSILSVAVLHSSFQSDC